MRGIVPIRRTKQYLEKGDIFLRHTIRILTFAFNNNENTHPHEGLK